MIIAARILKLACLAGLVAANRLAAASAWTAADALLGTP